jgi:hypothetical protein
MSKCKLGAREPIESEKERIGNEKDSPSIGSRKEKNCCQARRWEKVMTKYRQLI